MHSMALPRSKLLVAVKDLSTEARHCASCLLVPLALREPHFGNLQALSVSHSVVDAT